MASPLPKRAILPHQGGGKREGTSGELWSFGNGDSRAFEGAIVTFVNLDNDDLKVIHRGGYAWEEKSFARTGGKRVRVVLSFLDVIRRMCEEADAWTGTWRVRTICTPLSIYQDLAGVRAQGRTAQRYEAQVLSKAGRIDMWEGSYTLETARALSTARTETENRKAEGVIMKKFVLAGLALAALVFAAPALATEDPPPPEHVVICHVAGLASDPANYITLDLPWVAVYGEAGHFFENGTPRAGHEQDTLGECNPPPPPVDVCPNLEGNQATVPAGYHLGEDANGRPVCIQDSHRHRRTSARTCLATRRTCHRGSESSTVNVCC